MTTLEIARQFAIEGEISEVKALGEGFINDTYKVYVKGCGTPRYILQRKNHIVFPDVPAMMDNIYRITEHIRAKVDDKARGTLTVVKATDGKLYFKTEEGNYWTVCTFIQGSACYDKADTPALAYQGGRGLGLFHSQVNDFDEPLTEIIKGFHNIRWRFTQWDASVKADKAGRVRDLAEEISWIESRREKMLAFWEKFEKGEFPTRVTHNDTKISNFLFDSQTGGLLCAIDLDTLMSSTVMNDVGDALRSYTNTGAEDDANPDNVNMSMDMYMAYMEGYLSYMKDKLTGAEKSNLAFSGLYITYEQVLRFLMDYIDGDTYYKTKYPEHNLVRTRAQYKLLQSMESQLPEMQKFIDEL